MRLVEISHANVPGLIEFFKNIIFVYEKLKPVRRAHKSRVRNASHIAGKKKTTENMRFREQRPACGQLGGAPRP